MDEAESTKRNRITLGRRALLAAAGGIALAGAGLDAIAGPTSGAPAAAARLLPAALGRFAGFEWLGNAGWRVTTPSSTILVDPYLSRFDTGFAAGRFAPNTPLSLSTAAIDAALGAGAVSAVLVTHTHWDHFADVPHIAATRGAMVYTTLTGYQLGQAMGLAAVQLAVVKGGEELHVGDAVVRVVRSLHSRTASGGLLFPGVRSAVAQTPANIADLPEGDTLGFVIRRSVGDAGVLLLGASDFEDHALAGLDVDTVALPLPSNDVTAGYVSRLMRVLEKPRTVVLVHWDDFESPLRNPPRASDATRSRIADVAGEIARVSPRTRVVVPTYLRSMALL